MCRVVLSVSSLALCGAAIFIPQAAWSRDETPPPPPCALTATLRVAGAASLAGIQSLQGCSNIVVAPGTPAEMPKDVRIAPESEEGSSGDRAASFQLVSGKKHRDAEPASMLRVAAIAPLRQEPASLTAAVASDDAILAMRPLSYATRYDAMIQRVAARRRVDPLLLHAVIDQESRYRADARSPVGAHGLMQLMPGTARMLNVSASNAEANVDGGARLLRQLHGRFNDFNLTLAAYNAGEGTVRRYGNRVPPYRETQSYVAGVMGRYSRLLAEQAARSR
ncbi:Soluble lytic murein transglycosylase [Sphingomonas sp. NFR04]|uniref:lytic transglycosylase domain-containing protein n=1 Tax=Sphingomonas sp. NFR04 TaxID=1566283 RepID=UPI0008EFE57E|nr:lytic transglycosylase domain-containing protein [Sphingomonas sp. NFR04]SFJ64845.1 Soluble lytic murein transglycosylase [Sphingomonas sp. NFR04]